MVVMMMMMMMMMNIALMSALTTTVVIKTRTRTMLMARPKLWRDYGGRVWRSAWREEGACACGREENEGEAVVRRARMRRARTRRVRLTR
eukprot:7752814-Pyramimonas_sp.AAC.1